MPLTEYYANGDYYRYICKACYKKKANESRRRKKMAQAQAAQAQAQANEMRKSVVAGMCYCKMCNMVKPLEEFYQRRYGGHSTYCKDCERARAREQHRKRIATKEGREKRRAQRIKYRDTHRAQLAEAARIRRRQAGIGPRHRVDKEKILKMYAEGLPVPDIAKACLVKEHTVRQYAAKSGIQRVRHDRVKACRNCWLYPCFTGIENMSSNLAETCKSFRLKSAKVKAKKNGEKTARNSPKNANFTV